MQNVDSLRKEHICWIKKNPHLNYAECREFPQRAHLLNKKRTQILTMQNVDSSRKEHICWIKKNPHLNYAECR